MDEKWLKSAYQFDDEPSGGGGEEPTPEPSGDGEEPGAVRDEGSEFVSDALETRGDRVDVDDSDLGGEGDSDAPPIALPEDLAAMFSPPEPPPATGPPPAQPPVSPAPVADQPGLGTQEPPPQVDFPTGDEWFEDAGKAAEKQAAAIAWSNWKSSEPLRQAIQQIQGRFQQDSQSQYEAKVIEVGQAIDATQNAVAGYYAEDGPLNRDKEFRENPQLQESTKVIIQECLRRAIMRADQTGDTEPLRRMTSDAKFIPRILAIAKADTVTPDPGFKPSQSPAGKQPGKPSKRDGLTLDQRKALAAARAEGMPYTAEDIKNASKVIEENVY